MARRLVIEKIQERALNPPIVFPPMARVVETEVMFLADPRLECYLSYAVSVDMGWEQLKAFYETYYPRPRVWRDFSTFAGRRRQLTIPEDRAIKQGEITFLLYERAFGRYSGPVIAGRPVVAVTISLPEIADRVGSLARRGGPMVVIFAPMPVLKD